MNEALKAGYVAIIGRPNAGKSTLLNAVLQAQISIVTPKAQTTRDRVMGILSEDRGQVVFVDTPGIHRARVGGINHYMVNDAREALDSPNLVWYIVDPSSALEHESAVLELLDHAKVPVFMLINKMDWVGKKIPLSVIDSLEQTLTENMKERGIDVRSSQRISALAKDGLKDLLDQSWAYIPEGPPFYPDLDQISDRPTRFFVAEKIRERLFYLLGDEVPYSCAIEIENFDEKSKPPRIEAIIHVERDSQKGIVIGQGGKKIKDIGTSARKEIEDFLGEKIFLGLKVKVLKDWSQNAEVLKRLGYNIAAHRKTKL
jgi:GTP-binding protein Era